MKKILFALTLLLSFGSTLWIEKASAAKVVFVPIYNSDDWLKFRDEVQKAKGQYWVDARLEADITTGGGIGLNSDTPYRGTFDGNGHTLTVDINRGDGKACAVFCYVGDVTIRDLHVKGKISGGIHSAGLIGVAGGGTPTLTIDRVWVSTEVNVNDSHAGGIIGHSNRADVYMNDCRFDGKVNTNKADYSFAGEIIGWCNGGGWTFHRVYDQGSPNAHWMFYCIDYNQSTDKWSSWGGNGKSSLTVTQHGWDNVNHYNKTDQTEVMNLMNGEKANSWHLIDGKAVPVMNQGSTEGWKLPGGSNGGYVLQSGYYYVPNNATFTGGYGESGLAIADGATVYIQIPKGVMLSATGGRASGRTGAGAGIELPQSSKLYLMGEGLVVAYGGDAANGANGDQGDNGGWSDAGPWAGSGGAGGAGGGGAGAGIGTRGADGGSGGSKAQTSRQKWTDAYGSFGNGGSTGGTAQPMGVLLVEETYGLSVSAKGGKAGTRGGAGGSKGQDAFMHQTSSYNYSIAGGGGGGGGGFGGKANDIGTGGPGGGGGGSGSGGSIGCNWLQLYRAGSYGGSGGYNADGSQAGKGGDSYLDNAHNAEIHNYLGSATFKDQGWYKRDWRRSAGSGAGCGGASKSNPTNKQYKVRFNVMEKFGGNVDESKSFSASYLSNVDNTQLEFNMPTFDELGLIQQDKYLSQWNTQKDGQGSWIKVGETVTVGIKPTELYVEWRDYQDIFPEGSGTKSDPFIIEEGELIELADYVNSGASTRNLYFKQKGDIIVKDILAQNNGGSNWTPIGQNYAFEGDYDGAGNCIRNAEMNQINGSAIGIFGKVAGCIHNLGVEKVTINSNDNNARCGALAGILCQDDKGEIAGQMKNCYAANNTITAPYAAGLVGEMKEKTSMSHCFEAKDSFTSNNWGGLASIIHADATVDLCFTTGKFSSNNYQNAQNSAVVDETKLAGGELTWLLNDKTAFATTWYQNVDTEGSHNAYPVLSSTSKPVYSDGQKYTNQPVTIFEFSGKGRRNDPFLITSKDDWEKLANFCNSGNNTTGMYFLQTADFDLNGGGITPIGNPHQFAGNYDGGGHTIRNGNIETYGPLGVFAYVSGTVTRLCVENTIIKGINGGARAGGIAGRLQDSGEISNCLVKDCDVSVKDDVWGVAGSIVGDVIHQGVVRNCLAYRNKVKASDDWFGYICGATENEAKFERCYTDGNLMVSSHRQGTFTDCTPGLDESSLGTGEIAYELNNGDINPEPAWYQNLNSGSELDSIPVLSSSHAMVFKNDKGNYTNDHYDLSSLGKGTEEEPYKIGTPKDFMNLVKTIIVMKRSNFYVKQTADIDLKDSVLVPIGTCTDGFEGYYDGGGYVIKNLQMTYYKDNPDESMGLFNNIIGTVERLGIENCSFKADGPINRVGALAGRLSGNGVLRNCFVKGTTVDFHDNPGVVVGALVGEQTDNASMEACYGYQNTVIGQNDGRKHYGYIVGYIGDNAKTDLVFTDGPALCADKQSGAQNITHSEKGVSDFRFKAGELCWVLNGSKDNGTIWHQTMHTDSWPVPHPEHKPIYRYSKDGHTMYCNTNEMPYTIVLSLYPNYDEKPAETFSMFKADDNYIIPGFELKPHAIERPDYELAGWSTQANGKGTFYPYDGEVLPIEANASLYAVWDIKVPTSGNTKVVVLDNLRKDTAFYKVYDDGGHRLTYSPNCNGKLTLKAPSGRCLRLTGTVATEAPGSDGKPHDYMSVYEKDEDNQLVKLTNEKGESVFYSQSNGDKLDIGGINSSAEEIMIEFVSGAENCYEGLDLTVTILPAGVQELAGRGTAESPFQVETVADLKSVNNYIKLTGDSKIYIEQVADIDLNGEAFTPLASSVESFQGHYDGGGFAIRNMKMDAAEGSAVGLFSKVSGVVERLGMVDCTIAGAVDNSVIGIIAGSLSGNGQVRNCYAIGNSVSFVAQDRVFTMGTEYTAERFASGEVCYLLNEGKTENPVWRQTLGTDNMPVFNDSHAVVYTYLRNDRPAYSNSEINTPQYYISSKEDFIAFIEKPGDIYLTQDIDLGLTNGIPCLNGNFDGGGHTITYIGRHISKGLFENIYEGASLKHLRVNVDNIAFINSCGGIAHTNEGTISDCHFQGRIICKINSIASIAVEVKGKGAIDHCSATGTLHSMMFGDYSIYTITKDTDRATNCTWVDPKNQTDYAAHRAAALAAQAEYPVYAKGILDAVGPEVIVGKNSISAPRKHLSSLTITDGERFSCSAEVTVDQITYKRRGTNGAYELWVLPFEYTIDSSMLSGGVEFYHFEEDSKRNIQMKEIRDGEVYNVFANAPLVFRTTDAAEHIFQMKLVKGGSQKPFVIKMPIGGVAISRSNTKDIARVMVAYDTIPAARTGKELMHIWNSDKADFILTNGDKEVTPFRYYMQYVDKETGNFLTYEQTEWARKQQNRSGGSRQGMTRTALQAPFSTLTAKGWQPIILDLNSTQTITAQMLNDYEILYLSDIYEQKVDERYDVSVIYEPAEEDMTLPYALPLLVRAKHAGVEPLVTAEMGADLIALMREALEEMDEDKREEASESLFENYHYWCSTFDGRYDVWQMLLPESDNELNEYGALVFGDNADAHHFYRVGPGNGFTMQPMSYCFTAYDNNTFENLPLTNDRIQIVAYGYTEQSVPTGIEEVGDEKANATGDAYNLQGQKVDNRYRGLIIQNGRKIMKK